MLCQKKKGNKNHKTLRENLSNLGYRATVFFQIAAVGLMSTVFGVPSAWYLMDGNLYIPIWISFAFIVSPLPLVFFIPETLKREKAEDPVPVYEETTPTDTELSRSRDATIKGRFLKFCSDAKEASFVLRSPMLLALSVTFLFQSLGGRSGEYQYMLASERFHWKLKDVREENPERLQYNIFPVLTS